MEQYDGRMKI